MKQIMIATLLVCSSVVSAEIDGKAFYKKRCSACHGAKGERPPLRGMRAIAGVDAGVLARKVRAYRDQASKHGVAHSIYEQSEVMRQATSSLSNQQISAIAIYLSSLK